MVYNIQNHEQIKEYKISYRISKKQPSNRKKKTDFDQLEPNHWVYI